MHQATVLLLLQNKEAFRPELNLFVVQMVSPPLYFVEFCFTAVWCICPAVGKNMRNVVCFAVWKRIHGYKSLRR